MEAEFRPTGPEWQLLRSENEWGVQKLPGALQAFTAHKDTSHKLLLVAKFGSVSSDGNYIRAWCVLSHQANNLVIESVEGCLGRPAYVQVASSQQEGCRF